MDSTANADASEIEDVPDYTVSRRDAYQNTLLAHLITKCPGIFGIFGPGVRPYSAAQFPKRLNDERLIELTRP